MNRLTNWIEIPVSDIARAKRFYGAITQGQLHELTIGPTTYAIFATEDESNCGALAQGPDYKPSREGALIYLDGGDDLSVLLRRVVASGGTVTLDKTFISEQAGYIGLFIDTEGNRVGVHSMQ